MKRTFHTVFAASFFGAILTGLAFVNNIVAIVRWWNIFASVGGDTSQMPAKTEGFIHLLDWTAVDYSAVTTFIPFLGFLFLTRASWRLMKGRRQVPDDFPFFKGSDQLNVALGLFGTLWGIIVIGYFRLDTVQMADLMQCLHTALFSTLMAVVWVFLIDRPLIRPWFVRLMTRAGLAEADEGDLTGAVSLFVSRLREASDAFDARQKAYEAAFLKNQKEFEEAFAKRQNEYERAIEKSRNDYECAIEKRQSDYEAAFAKRLTDYEAAFAKRQADYDAALAKREADSAAAFAKREREYVEIFQREIAQLEKRAELSERKLAAVLKALHE